MILLDVVLGHGAEPDPAAAARPGDRAARADRPVGRRRVVGTDPDPQGLDAPGRGASSRPAPRSTCPTPAATRRALELLGAQPDDARPDQPSSPSAPTCSPTPSPARPSPSPASTGARRCPAPRPTSPPSPPTRCRRDANAPRARPRCSASRRTSSTSRPPREVLGLERRPVPARRPADRAGTRASGPLRGALMGGAALEGLVDDPEDAVALFESGSVGLASSRATTAAPSARWPAWSRRRCGCSCSRTAATGRADVLLAQRGPRQGAALRRLRPRGADPAALDGRRARPAAAGRGPRGDAPGRSTSPAILTQMLQMGDEAHNRNRAGTLMLLRDLAPAMVDARRRRRRRRRGAAVRRRQRPLLPQPRDARLQARARRRAAASTARRWSSRWPATAPTSASRSPAPATSGSPARRRSPTGLFLGDYGPDDANPDIGDSAITETAGHRRLRDGDRPGDRPLRRRLGARRAGHHPPDARDHARREPALVGAGAGVPGHARPASTSPGSAAPGSCRRSTPAWPASVAGVGQVGAGLVTPPAEIFPKALAASRRAGQASDRALVVDPGRVLAGELADRGHDLVGELAPGAAARYAVVLPRDVERRAEGDRDLGASRGRLEPTGWMSSVPASADRDDREPAVSARCATPVRPR